MEAPPTLPKKKDILEALLSESNVFLHLDPRKNGVVVPKWFQNQPELVLQLGLRMAVPIPDLEVDDEGVSCTLSFSRAPFWCCIPWSSVFAVVAEKDRRGVVWPDDVPPDGQSARSIKPAKPRPKLAAVPAWDPSMESAASEPDGERSVASDEAEAALPPIGPDTKCGVCGTPWVEDQSSCPVCGSSAAEALRPPAAAKPAASAAKPAASERPAPALVAVDAPAADATPPSKRGGPRSKPKPRPALAAAPPAPPSSREPEAAAEPSAQPKTATSSAAAEPADERVASQPPKKTGKRELPPYLRVVK